MISTVEYIHHYTCDQCKGWWSIASHENYKPKAMYCPHCGHKHSVINNVDVKNGTPQKPGR
jgi:transcription elongation factor Elf1